MPLVSQQVALADRALPTLNLNDFQIEGDPEVGFFCVYTSWKCECISLRSNMHLRSCGYLGAPTNPLIYCCRFSFDPYSSEEFQALGTALLMRNSFQPCYIQIPTQKKIIVFARDPNNVITMSEQPLTYSPPHHRFAEV